MKRFIFILCIFGILLPLTAFTEEGGDSPDEFIVDDPNMEITPNPLMDLDVISNAGFASFKTDEARTLDKYTNSKIEFDILVDADILDMRNIFLVLSIYDVDALSTTPEIDKVYLNDHYIGNLTGNNDSWSFTTFPLKQKWVKGLDEDDLPGVNKITILVDQLKATTFWVLCDWGAIKSNIGFQVISIQPQGRTYEDEPIIVYIKFNEEILEDSLKGNIKLTYIDFNEIRDIRGQLSYDYENKTAVFTTLESLTYGVEYTVSVATGIQNILGNRLRKGRKSSFVPLPALKRK